MLLNQRVESNFTRVVAQQKNVCIYIYIYIYIYSKHYDPYMLYRVNGRTHMHPPKKSLTERVAHGACSALCSLSRVLDIKFRV